MSRYMILVIFISCVSWAMSGCASRDRKKTEAIPEEVFETPVAADQDDSLVPPDPEPEKPATKKSKLKKKSTKANGKSAQKGKKSASTNSKLPERK